MGEVQDDIIPMRTLTTTSDGVFMVTILTISRITTINITTSILQDWDNVWRWHFIPWCKAVFFCQPALNVCQQGLKPFHPPHTDTQQYFVFFCLHFNNGEELRVEASSQGGRSETNVKTMSVGISKSTRMLFANQLVLRLSDLLTPSADFCHQWKNSPLGLEAPRGQWHDDHLWANRLTQTNLHTRTCGRI